MFGCSNLFDWLHTNRKFALCFGSIEYAQLSRHPLLNSQPSVHEQQNQHERELTRSPNPDPVRHLPVSGTHHFPGLLAVEHAAQVGDDLAHVVVVDARAPAGADAVGSIDEHHGDDGHVPVGLDA